MAGAAHRNISKYVTVLCTLGLGILDVSTNIKGALHLSEFLQKLKVLCTYRIDWFGGILICRITLLLRLLVQSTFNICRKPGLNIQWQVQRTGIFLNTLRCSAPWGCGILDVSINIKGALHLSEFLQILKVLCTYRNFYKN